MLIYINIYCPENIVYQLCKKMQPMLDLPVLSPPLSGLFWIGYWRTETAVHRNRAPENLWPNLPLSDKLRRAHLYRNCFIARKNSGGKLVFGVSLFLSCHSKCMYFINWKRVMLPYESLTTLRESYCLKRVKLLKQVMFYLKRVILP